ncbi:MAG: hypothetical protein ICV84_02390 [Flavisolibacter sp.]|nr:hypothetical protein [Flavisolibacter sp.]
MAQYFIPTTQHGRLKKKEELALELQILNAKAKRLQEHIQLLEKQKADVLKEAKETDNYLHAITHALKEGEYKILMKERV